MTAKQETEITGLYMKWCHLSIYFCVDNFQVITRLLNERQITRYIYQISYAMAQEEELSSTVVWLARIEPLNLQAVWHRLSRYLCVQKGRQSIVVSSFFLSFFCVLSLGYLCLKTKVFTANQKPGKGGKSVWERGEEQTYIYILILVKGRLVAYQNRTT